VDPKQTRQQSLRISREELLSLVRAFIGGIKGREDDEHPLPPGPWDPVTRVALEHIRFFGPSPEPWRVFGQEREKESQDPLSLLFQTIFDRHPELAGAIGRGHRFGEEVALNPQPLPPRYVFLIAATQVVIRRAELLHELASAVSPDGSSQSIIIVGGYTSRFTEDWCGTGFKLRWPFPGPRPHWFPNELDGIDLIVVATQFEQAAKEAFDRQSHEHFATAAAKFAEAGLSRVQYLMDQHEDA
jgi:hypothetical protein